MILNKVYEATLILTYDWFESGDEYCKFDTRFCCKEKDASYTLNKNGDWIYGDGWFIDVVPCNLTIKTTSSGLYKAVQGFSKKPTPQEEEILKGQMADAILDQLQHDKDEYMKIYEAKIKGLKGEN